MGLYRYGRKIAGNSKSAYYLALAGGYEGTETEFNESLGKIGKLTELHGDVDYLKNLSVNSIFKIKNITLTQDLFSNNIYILPNKNVTEESILNTYYSETSLETATNLQLIEESVDEGIKFTIKQPLETFSVTIDVILVMNIDFDPDNFEANPTVVSGNIIDNTTTTLPGYAVDARQLNPDIDGSYANIVSIQIAQLQQQIQALQKALNGCWFEFIDGIPHIVWDDEKYSDIANLTATEKN